MELEIIISKNESYTLHDDGTFYSHQSDKNENATDIPQYLFQIVDFVVNNYKTIKTTIV